jgi:CheY-like chemotaxis protein
MNKQQHIPSHRINRKADKPDINNIRFNKVLVIDDNPIDIFIFQKILEIASFTKEVIIKTTAASALEFLSQCKTKDDLPDFIFLDLFMPTQTGHDFLRVYAKKSRMIRNKCKVVILSILIYEGEVQNLLKNPNVYMLLRKPLTLESLNALKELNSIQLRSQNIISDKSR